MHHKLIKLILYTTLLITSFSSFAKVQIVAAENFYGNIAEQIGGDKVEVTTVLNNPQQDPHLFTPTPSVAKRISQADIVVYNGAHYSDWMPKLLSVKGERNHRKVIVVADLVNLDSKTNPHIWYDPLTIWEYAQNLTDTLIDIDTPNTSFYQTNLARLEKKQKAFIDLIDQTSHKIAGLPISATEPVFDYMTEALNLKMEVTDFQWSVVNNGAPSASAMQEMLSAIENNKIHALIYNEQVVDPMITNLLNIAKSHNIPVVPVTETLPPDKEYYEWMTAQIQLLLTELTQ